MGDYIVVNYHYVRNKSRKYSGINSCPIREFDRQIKFLSRNFKIVSIPEVFAAAQKNFQGKFCALSFDDCLKDAYVNAFPIIKKYKATAAIFLISSVLEQKFSEVHKLHILLSKFGPGELIDEFNKMFKGKYLISKNKRMYKDKRMDDDILTANLKETLTIMPQNLKNDFINSVFKDLKLNEQELVEEMFMNKNEINELCDAGFCLGSHSYSHNNLSDLGIIEIRKDFRKAQKTIANFFGRSKKIDIFSYPSGRWSKDVIDVLRSEGIKYGLTVEERSVSNKDNRFLIPRYDTNNLRDFLNHQK